MRKFLLVLLLLTIGKFSSQSIEIAELKKIENKYDSILITYQKKAKDSLAKVSKKERQRIMYKQEQLFLKEKEKKQEEILYKIISLEDKQGKIVTTKTTIKCPNFQNTPYKLNFTRSNKYKPTPNIDDKNLKTVEVKTTDASFIVDEYGNISNVRAFGSDLDFNKEVMLTLYLLDKLQPACNNGFATKARFRVPITLVLE